MQSQKPDAAQIRAAISLLGWENDDLAKACNVTAQSISNIKRGVTRPQPRILAAIKRVLEFNSIEFLDNSGVRFKPQGVEIFEGGEGFSKFYNFVYGYLSKYGGTVSVSGVDEKLFNECRPDAEAHRIRMTELVKQKKDIIVRILVKEGDYNFTGSAYAQYKWQPLKYFSPTAFYVFGDNIALISFAHKPTPLIILIQSATFAEAYLHAFNFAWESAKPPF